ncbi:MAG: hypothetical protein HY823_08440 [Acidobacteria bacterium]|nr:hypothetical protein [Acidobacteriota bacterium]
MVPEFHLASASGNAFAYLWAREAPEGFEGPRWARGLCAPGRGLALDGLFLLQTPRPGARWAMEHWDADGSASFCSNGTRAALAVPGAPERDEVLATSNGMEVHLRRNGLLAGIRMPEGPDFGLRPVSLDLPEPHTYGWIGNPQLVVERSGVAALDLGAFARPLRRHPGFKEGTNVNVVEVLDRGRARIRSWERGVEGETLCCGTGCAVAGAWLSSRTGQSEWVFETAGGEAVRVTAEAVTEGAWRGLWLQGPVHLAGAFRPGPSGVPW